jgi:hypothetical protein
MSSMSMSRTRSFAAVCTAAALVVGGGSAAVAAPSQGRTTMDVTCDGQVVTVTTPSGNDGDNWGAVQVSGGGHFLPVSLEYAVYDDTAAMFLDDEVLSHGGAHAHQRTISCVVATEQAVLGDVVPPGFGYPAGVAPTDTVTMSLRAVVVPRP